MVIRVIMLGDLLGMVGELVGMRMLIVVVGFVIGGVIRLLMVGRWRGMWSVADYLFMVKLPIFI
jgi:hypothetical protein